MHVEIVIRFRCERGVSIRSPLFKIIGLFDSLGYKGQSGN